MTTVVFCHGHGASKDSFSFVKTQIDSDEIIDLEYCSDKGFASNLKDMLATLEGVEDIVLIGHSLGGLYALHLADVLGSRVKSVVTIATPFGGSEAAVVLNVMWPQQLYRDIHPYADPIRHGKRIVLQCPLTAIVTTKGHSQLMAAANDGVVTKDSMYNRQGANFVEVHSTHHEVVMNMQTIGVIKEALAALEENMEEA